MPHNALYLYFVLLVYNFFVFLLISLNWLPPVDCPFLNVLGFPKHVIQHLKQTNKINNASMN